MRSRKLATAATLIAVSGLVAAACGDDDSGGSATTVATTAAATTAATTAAATTSAGVTTTAGATTTAATGGGGLVVPDYSKLGQDATNKKLYKGTGGFSIDVSKCPSDWNAKQGITDKEISVFISLPKSGPLAGFGLIADGAINYFNYIGTTGGIGGRQIKLDVKDDVYQAAQTKTNVNEALQTKKYAALLTILGTPNNLAIWDSTNEQCMPQLLNGTGGADWGDVENHPWTTGMQLDYWTEGSIWVDYLKKTYPSGAKLAMITFNNDFGKQYANAVKAGIKGTNLTLAKEELHEATAPNLTNNFTNLAATNADVLLIQTSGAFCTQAMAEVEKGSWKPKSVVMSATCGSTGQFFKPLVDQGLTGKDTIIIETIKNPLDPVLKDDPFVKLWVEQMTKGGLDPKQSTYFTGWVFAYYMTEILKAAEKMQGGLDRGNIMIAARSIVLPKSPVNLLDTGVKMEGLKDAYLTEFGRLAKYTITDPKVLGTFVPLDEKSLINVEGKLGTFATVKKASVAA